MSAGNLIGRVVNVFTHKHCIGIRLKEGGLSLGDEITIIKPPSAGPGTEIEFTHRQTIESMQVDKKPISGIHVLENPDGSKDALIYFVGEPEPTQTHDRRCAIEITAIPPNGAEVFASQ